MSPYVYRFILESHGWRAAGHKPSAWHLLEAPRGDTLLVALGIPLRLPAFRGIMSRLLVALALTLVATASARPSTSDAPALKKLKKQAKKESMARRRLSDDIGNDVFYECTMLTDIEADHCAWETFVDGFTGDTTACEAECAANKECVAWTFHHKPRDPPDQWRCCVKNGLGNGCSRARGMWSGLRAKPNASTGVGAAVPLL